MVTLVEDAVYALMCWTLGFVAIKHRTGWFGKRT
jgi:hypothetical protein